MRDNKICFCVEAGIIVPGSPHRLRWHEERSDEVFPAG